MPHLQRPVDVAEALHHRGYLADIGLASAGFLALSLQRPLFLEGEPGVGKTSFAAAIASVLDARLIRLQCYEGIDATQALYDWNFPRQILYLRTVEVDRSGDPSLMQSVYSRDFLVERPILQALQPGPTVLLIDEIDRADDQFEALLLEVLSEYQVSIPELGIIRSDVPPLVVLTSNRTRDVHDALKRRCIYHWIGHPTPEHELMILRRRVPQLSDPVLAAVTRAMQKLRTNHALIKVPGIAESIDLAQAVLKLGADSLDPDTVEAALGTVAKHQDDINLVRQALIDQAATSTAYDRR